MYCENRTTLVGLHHFYCVNIDLTPKFSPTMCIYVSIIIFNAQFNNLGFSLYDIEYIQTLLINYNNNNSQFFRFTTVFKLMCTE